MQNKLFEIETSIGTAIYANEREKVLSDPFVNLDLFDIVHLNNDGIEEVIKKVKFKSEDEKKMKKLEDKVYDTHCVFEEGLKAGIKHQKEVVKSVLF